MIDVIPISKCDHWEIYAYHYFDNAINALRDLIGHSANWPESITNQFLDAENITHTYLCSLENAAKLRNLLVEMIADAKRIQSARIEAQEQSERIQTSDDAYINEKLGVLPVQSN